MDRTIYFDAYQVGGNALDGLNFEVKLIGEGENLKVSEVRPATGEEELWKRIKWEKYTNQVKEVVEGNIRNLRSRYSDIEQEFKDYHQETGDNGINLLNEI